MHVSWLSDHSQNFGNDFEAFNSQPSKSLVSQCSVAQVSDMKWAWSVSALRWTMGAELLESTQADNLIYLRWQGCELVSCPLFQSACRWIMSLQLPIDRRYRLEASDNPGTILNCVYLGFETTHEQVSIWFGFLIGQAEIYMIARLPPRL